MSWRNFQDSTPKDKTDKRDKTPGYDEQHAPFVPFIPFVVGGEDQKRQDDPFDPFQASGEAIKVYLPPLDADVWFCADRQAAERVAHEEIAWFLYEDLVYIYHGKPGADRLSRLIEVYSRRHPMTQHVVEAFDGKATSIRMNQRGE